MNCVYGLTVGFARERGSLRWRITKWAVFLQVIGSLIENGPCPSARPPAHAPARQSDVGRVLHEERRQRRLAAELRGNGKATWRRAAHLPQIGGRLQNK